MICARAQMFTHNDRLLRNSPSLPQFKISLLIKAVIHFRYIISFVLLDNRVKAVFYLLTEYFIHLFIDPT